MKHFSTTNYTNYTNRLRHSSCLRIVMLLALFTLHCSLFISLVRAQDAFYIYRNDGDFNGFFYDQVIRMGYSKFDLDSVEHDKYVVQEVETTDSLYRIPLAAIDSIGFQQPEIRFNPRLKNMDDLGITPYVSHVDEYKLALRFDKSMPTAMIPSEGDVLTGFNQEKYGQSGFVGKVREVRRYPSGVVDCELDSISDWGDIFDQFITVEQLGIDNAGNVRRRVAGFDENGRLRSPQKEWSGNNSLNIINWSGRLQYDWGNGLTIGIDVGAQVKATATYAVTGVFSKRFFMKLIFSESLSAGASIHAQISGGDEIEINTPLGLLGGIKFPAVFPLFEVDPIPKGFFRYGGSIDASIQLPTFSFGASQTVVIDTDTPQIMDFEWGNRDGEGSYDNVETDFSWINAGVVFNGFVQTGVKTQLGLNTNSWLSKLLHAGIGLEIYFGPKLEAELNLSASGALASGSYGALKDSRLAMTPACMDRELKYKWRVGKKKEERTMWNDSKKWGETSWYLFPDFLKTKAVVAEKDKSVNVTVYPRRQVLLSTRMGVGLYRKNDMYGQPVAEIDYSSAYGYRNQFNEFETVFDKVGAGTYIATPYVTLFGTKLSVFDSNVFTEVVVPPMIVLEKDSVEVDSQTKTVSIPFVTNCPEVSVKSQNLGFAKQITTEIDSVTQTGVLTIDLNDNQELVSQGGDVILSATVDGVTVKDTVTIGRKGLPFEIDRLRIDVGVATKGTMHYWGVNIVPYDKTDEEVGWQPITMGQGKDKDYEMEYSRDGDFLIVKASRDLSEGEKSSSTTTYDGGSETDYSSHTRKESITFVVDISKEPFKIVRGSLDIEYYKQSHYEMTHYYNWGNQYYRDRTGNSSSNESRVVHAEWTMEVNGNVEQKYRYIHFNMPNSQMPDNWVKINHDYEHHFIYNVTNYDKNGNVTSNDRTEKHSECHYKFTRDYASDFDIYIYY